MRGPLDVNVFASSSNEHLIVENQEYVENIFNEDRVMYLKLSCSFTTKNEGYTILEIANCVGNQSTVFLSDPSD
jgi:hypothetical protein